MSDQQEAASRAQTYREKLKAEVPDAIKEDLLPLTVGFYDGFLAGAAYIRDTGSLEQDIDEERDQIEMEQALAE